jgi:hypothetical protein
MNTFREFLSEGKEQEFQYMMLGRLETDVEYFLGAGNGSEKHLWAGNVKDQIKEMKKIWNMLKVKPEWLTMDQIKQYEKDMMKK